MRPTLILVALGYLVLLTVRSPAEEPPHLEFARGLRARGMADLALQYLQSKSQNPPAELKAILPLELAKTRLELAATKTEPSSRLAEQSQAKAEFELFIQNNPKHPLVAEARLEIARIAVLQGKAQFGKARRQEVKELQLAELARARTQFEEAGKLLTAAAAQIDAQLATYQGQATAQAESEKQSLSQARLQAELETGINFLQQAQTFTEQADGAKRGELFKKAMAVLEKLSKSDPKNSICVQAHAWLGRCYQENEDPKAARKVYADVIAETGDAADAARRLARYFRLQTLQGEGDPKKALAEVVKAGEEWQIIYSGYLNTPEGYGVRYELASAYLQQALLAPRLSLQARAAFERAQKLFQGLEQSENEYSTVAREKRLQIILTVSQERSRGDISKLKDFDECYLRAQLEVARMQEDGKKLKGDELDEKRKQHFKDIIQAISRGLDLPDVKISSEDINDARYLLTYAYLSLADYYRAAVCGEDLARTEARFPGSAMAGAYAVQAYYMLLGQQEQGSSDKAELEPIRNRLRGLAQYIERVWPTDTAADMARHLLGLELASEKNYPEAVAVLERISAGYPDATRAMFRLAAAALNAQKEDSAQPAPGKSSYQDRALAALMRIPDLSPSADIGTINDYVAAKLTLGRIYYSTKQFDKMEVLTEALLKKVDELDPKTQAEHRVSVLIGTMYAKFGRAEAEHSAGNYGKARALLDPLVNQAKDPAQAELVSQLKEKDPQVLKLVLGLALRASVQDNLTDRGREILELLQKSFPDNSLDIMVQFVKQLNAQIQQLKAQGAAAQEKLDKMVKSFSAFLDVLARQQEMNPKAELMLFLAQSYSTLDNHQRAAELANKIEEPKPQGDKKELDPKLVQLYHFARILLVRELRLGKEFAKADLILQEILATKWGQQNLEVQKERIMLLEDQEKYVLPAKKGAITDWNNLMKTLTPRRGDNRINEQYFDCYYHYAYCMYKYALSLADPKLKRKYLGVAANYILQLEKQTGSAADMCKKRFEDLLEKEAELKGAYDELKKNNSK